MVQNGDDSRNQAKTSISNLNYYVYFYVISVFYVFDAFIIMILLVVAPFFYFFLPCLFFRRCCQLKNKRQDIWQYYVRRIFLPIKRIWRQNLPYMLVSMVLQRFFVGGRKDHIGLLHM